MKRIFVSYARADQAIASRIVNFLRRAGFEVWWDQDMAGEPFNRELKQRIGQSAVVICLLSPSFLASAYCDGEMSAASSESLLPVEIAPVANADVPIPLARFNRLSLVSWAQGTDQDAALALIDACSRRLGVTVAAPRAAAATPAPAASRPDADNGSPGSKHTTIQNAGFVIDHVSGGTFSASVGDKGKPS